MIVALSSEVGAELPKLCRHSADACSHGVSVEFTDMQRLTFTDIASSASPNVEATQARARFVIAQLTRGTNATRNAAHLFLRAKHMVILNASPVCGPTANANHSTRALRSSTSRHIRAPRFAPCQFYFVALKKILLVASSRCERVWLVDTESVPFRSFSFAQVFDDYWQGGARGASLPVKGVAAQGLLARKWHAPPGQVLTLPLGVGRLAAAMFPRQNRLIDGALAALNLSNTSSGAVAQRIL